ncbi:DmsE family decaheme c-type cytochrome [Denitratisoma oestradiolicum]|nr:DmsE family decaheme c-type cytochrome [Denitratisoma oestradiolicum]TWO80853.1 cytochrome C [Denitratisoma oestradiolicum]
MKLLRQALTLCAFAGLLGGVSSAMAVENPKAAEKKTVKKDLVLKDDARCTECHDEADSPEILRVGKTKHGTVADGRTPTCSNCHGDSNAHVDYKGSDKPPKPDVTFGKKSKTPVEAKNEACLSCHQGGNRISWQSSSHSMRGVACTSCHQVHNGHDKVRDKTEQTEVCYTCHKEQRAQMNRASHHPVPEGKMGCSSCHNVHGSNHKQLVKASTNETCYTCHMEKRGPFVHNHEPVSEDCGICHQPHGTNLANLLKSRPPMLCIQCHGPDSHPSQPPALLVGASTLSYNTNARAGFGTDARGCLNCHTNIHGGNSTQTNATAERFRR